MSESEFKAKFALLLSKFEPDALVKSMPVVDREFITTLGRIVISSCMLAVRNDLLETDKFPCLKNVIKEHAKEFNIMIYSVIYCAMTLTLLARACAMDTNWPNLDKND